MELEKLNEEIRNCKKCDLYKYRKNVVPGEGPSNSKVMLVGEAPGRFEDIQGRPFVGAAGKLLNEILFNLGVKRSDLFITNVVKCRPPNNRDPTEEEIKKCSPYLDLQISIIRPKLLITLGRHSSKYLIEKFGGKFSSISSVHGKVFHFSTIFGDFYLVPTYHPAAAIYNPSLRESIEKDMRRAFNLLKSKDL